MLEKIGVNKVRFFIVKLDMVSRAKDCLHGSRGAEERGSCIGKWEKDSYQQQLICQQKKQVEKRRNGKIVLMVEKVSQLRHIPSLLFGPRDGCAERKGPRDPDI